jgi:hypothetical protein
MSEKYYAVWNFIRDLGCKFLSRAELNSIKYINLGMSLPSLGLNQVSSVGILHLSKGQWRSLQEIHLGTLKYRFRQ